VTAADPPQGEAERFEKMAELDEADVPHLTCCEALPKILSA
jgi:hypothetical protein